MLINVVAWAVVVPPLVALLVFSIEVIAGLKPPHHRPLTEVEASAVVIVPAHNEELSIEKTVYSLRSAAGSSMRLLVVADNCTDSTADYARAAGAEVIKRDDPARRGKGFALARARDFLSLDPPDVVVVIDADCQIEKRSLATLVAYTSILRAPCQAVDLLVAPPHSPPLVQISNFAMLMKNWIRARGLYRLGGGITLFGTGMAFPWAIFRNAPLATSDTVEDLNLALKLADDGIRVHLVDAALVLSPSSAARDTLSQRRRWEHGFLATALKQALPRLVRGFFLGSRHQLALGLDLMVPPLAFLLAASVFCGLLAALTGWMGASFTPAGVLFAALTLSLVACLVAWLAYGRDVLSAKALLRAPFYVLQKIPLYIGFITARQNSWNRTPRREENE